MKLSAILLIIRPANVITAIADVIAGIAIVGLLHPTLFHSATLLHSILLCIATACLYAGGIVFNDVFDFHQDKINRPERVIPSGKLSITQAKNLGILLFSIALIATAFISLRSLSIAICIVCSALLYDKYAKHHSFLGPINMGLCRSLNLILGMTLLPSLELNYFFIGILPLIFISAITLTAQKETKGKNKLAIAVAMLLDLSIVFGFYILSKHFNFSIKNAWAFLLVWYGVNAFAKLNAILKNKPQLIMKAVKIGVLSLIPLNATYVAGFSSIINALLLLCLLPISLFLSKKFPVT